MLSPVLRRLKDSTADLHVEAERYVRILDRDATQSDYIRYLRAMHGYHAPLERMFLASDVLRAAGFDADVRCRKAQWMRADLAALDDACGAECAETPRLDSLSSAIGVAYVIEGSTLGGRFILAKLPPAIAALRGVATRYLEGYGAETGTRWRAFADLAERSNVDVAAAETAACETFAKLIAWLALHETRGTLPLAEAS